MSTPPLPALIFAAGFGTRMQHLTRDRPKPLIDVAGRPLIDHALTLAQDAGCAPILANLHYRADMLEAYLHPKGVGTLREHPDILETGGGLRNAMPQLGASPVLTLNSDAIWGGPNPVSLLLDAWRPDHMDALLVCVPPDQAVGHKGKGDFILSKNGAVQRGPGMVFGGIQIIKTDLLKDMPERAFSLNIVWDIMLEQQSLFGLSYPGHWCDVGHPAGITLAEDMLEAHGV